MSSPADGFDFFSVPEEDDRVLNSAMLFDRPDVRTWYASGAETLIVLHEKPKVFDSGYEVRVLCRFSTASDHKALCAAGERLFEFVRDQVDMWS